MTACTRATAASTASPTSRHTATPPATSTASGRGAATRRRTPPTTTRSWSGARGGASVTVTDDHPLFTERGWAEAASLAVGDKVAVLSSWDRWPCLAALEGPVEHGPWNRPRAEPVAFPVTEDLGRLIGYLMTDGSDRPGQSIEFTNTNPAYLAEVEGLGPRPVWDVAVPGKGWLVAQGIQAHNCGKAEAAAALALREALLVPGALVLLLSPSERQSGELQAKVFEHYDALGGPVPARKRTELQLHLVNRSRIIALPESERTVRGYSGARLLVVDEAARVGDALSYAVRPMLSVSRGRLQVARSLPEAPLLVREMENFQARITLARDEAFEAWREGEHDDLVLAVALAAWLGEQALPPLDDPPDGPEVTHLLVP